MTGCYRSCIILPKFWIKLKLTLISSLSNSHNLSYTLSLFNNHLLQWVLCQKLRLTLWNMLFLLLVSCFLFIENVVIGSSITLLQNSFNELKHPDDSFIDLSMEPIQVEDIIEDHCKHLNLSMKHMMFKMHYYPWTICQMTMFSLYEKWKKWWVSCRSLCLWM